MYGQDNRSVLFAFPAKRKSYADLKNIIGFEKMRVKGASSSVGSALCSYAERRGFEGSTLFDCFVRSRPIEHIVRFNARARASSRVLQVSSNFIPDAGYNTYVRFGLSTVIGFSSGVPRARENRDANLTRYKARNL